MYLSINSIYIYIHMFAAINRILSHSLKWVHIYIELLLDLINVHLFILEYIVAHRDPAYVNDKAMCLQLVLG